MEEKSSKELIEAVERFIGLKNDQKAKMGKAGCKIVEERFDRNIVVNKYIDEVLVAYDKRYYRS